MLPGDEEKKSGLCPICDAKVEIDAKKCPECKADLTVFGIKTGDEEIHDVSIPEYEESLERLLGKIGEKDEKKEHELFEEIMAAVDKTHSITKEEGDVEIAPEEKLEEGVEEGMEEGMEEVVEEGVEEAAEGAVMFECPLCNTLVGEDAKSCPGCGAIFAVGDEEEVAEGAVEEGEAEHYEVPAEEAPIEEVKYEAETFQSEIVEEEAEIEEIAPPEPKKRLRPGLERKKDEDVQAEVAEAKPSGEAVRDEKMLHSELAASVSEVKPLLATARQVGINVHEGRKLIDQAIAAGKKRDFETAIALVKESKKTIESTINQQIIDSVQTTQSKLEALSKAGGDVSELENMLAKVQLLLTERRYAEAIELAKKTAEDAEESILKLKTVMKRKERAEPVKDVGESVEALVELIKSGEEVKVNVKGAKTLLTQARVAIKRNEPSKAEDLLAKAREDFLRELPKQLAEIISSSKPVLYKAKMQGVDIRPSIKLLKQASTALKLNNYLDALKAIKRYKAEMTHYLE